MFHDFSPLKRTSQTRWMSRKLLSFPRVKVRTGPGKRSYSAAQIQRNSQCCCWCCWSSNAEKDDGLCASFVRKKKSPCNASAPHMCVGLYRVLQFGTQLMILCAVSSGTDFWGWNAHADHMFDKCFGRNIIPDSFFCFFLPVAVPLRKEVLMISAVGPYSSFSQKSNYYSNA